MPVLFDKDIEDFALAGLKKHFPACLTRPTQTPVLEILTRLKLAHGVSFDFVELPTRNGKKTVGRTVFSKNAMFFDASLLDDSLKPAFRFTAAHEIGHWSLHRHKKVFQMDTIEDSEADFEIRYRTREPKPARWWMEHQANVFAAALLMPRQTFLDAVRVVQKQLDIIHQLGTVFLDEQPINRQNYRATISYLKSTFGVSEKAARIRLEEMGILADVRYERVKSIAQIVFEQAKQ